MSEIKRDVMPITLKLETKESKFKSLKDGLQAAQDQVKIGRYFEYSREDFMQKVRRQATANRP